MAGAGGWAKQANMHLEKLKKEGLCIIADDLHFHEDDPKAFLWFMFINASSFDTWQNKGVFEPLCKVLFDVVRSRGTECHGDVLTRWCRALDQAKPALEDVLSTLKTVALHNADAVKIVVARFKQEFSFISELDDKDKGGPHFGEGSEPWLIYGNCQGGKTTAMLVCAWLAFWHCERKLVPHLFVMNSGGRFMLQNLEKAIADFNEEKVQKWLKPHQTDNGAFALMYTKEYKGQPPLSSMAQVVVALANVHQFKKETKIEKHRICLICDEDDLNVQTCTRDGGKLESELWRKESDQVAALRHSMGHVIGVTATVMGICFSENRPVHLLQIKPAANYYGISDRLHEERQLHREGGRWFNEDNIRNAKLTLLLPQSKKTEDKNIPLASQMFKDMLAKGNAVGLFHVFRDRADHEELAQALLRQAPSTKPLIVLVQNSGLKGDDTKDADASESPRKKQRVAVLAPPPGMHFLCSETLVDRMTQFLIRKELLKLAPAAPRPRSRSNSSPLSACKRRPAGSRVLARPAAAAGATDCHSWAESHQCDRQSSVLLVEGRFHVQQRSGDFRQNMKELSLGDVLTNFELFRREQSEKITIAIVTGYCGGRGMTYKDSKHCNEPEHALHLTHFFATFSETLPGEAVVQIANRLSGTYNLAPGAKLRLYMSKADLDRVLIHQRIIDEMVDILQANNAATEPKSPQNLFVESHDQNGAKLRLKLRDMSRVGHNALINHVSKQVEGRHEPGQQGAS